MIHRLNGNRVEIFDIENIVNSIDNVKQSVVIYNIKNGIATDLTLCIVKENEEIKKEEIIDNISKKIPKSMMPKNIIFLQSLLFNINGKVDRLALKKTMSIIFIKEITMNKIVSINALNKYYGQKHQIHCLKNIKLTIEKGDYISISGDSGSGKTTLLYILGFLDEDFTGAYKFNDQDVEKMSSRQLSLHRRKNIGFVFQSYNLIEHLNAEQNIMLAVDKKTPKKIMKLHVNDVLKKVGLQEHSKKYPSELSGGQQQRIAIARAIVNNPSMLLADEPTGNLDSENAEKIMVLLNDLNLQGMTICLVTHNDKFMKYATTNIHLSDGEITYKK